MNFKDKGFFLHNNTTINNILVNTPAFYLKKIQFPQFVQSQ